MKKVIVAVIAILLCTSSFGQVKFYKSFETAYGIKDTYSGLVTWGDWIDDNSSIVVDWDKKTISIYNETRQFYAIQLSGQTYNDMYGGYSIDCIASDANRKKYKIRFRIDPHGVSQLYRFSRTTARVYNVIEMK